MFSQLSQQESAPLSLSSGSTHTVELQSRFEFTEDFVENQRRVYITHFCRKPHEFPRTDLLFQVFPSANPQPLISLSASHRAQTWSPHIPHPCFLLQFLWISKSLSTSLLLRPAFPNVQSSCAQKTRIFVFRPYHYLALEKQKQFSTQILFPNPLLFKNLQMNASHFFSPLMSHVTSDNLKSFPWLELLPRASSHPSTWEKEKGRLVVHHQTPNPSEAHSHTNAHRPGSSALKTEGMKSPHTFLPVKRRK